MRDTVVTLSLSIAFEEFTHLEEKHNEDSLSKLSLLARKETDAQGSYGGNGHQEMLIEHIAMSNTLGSLAQGVMTYQQIGNKINQEQLPGGKRACLLDEVSSYKQ